MPAPALRKGDVVRVSAGEVIPADGEIIEGVASVDESAITGESAPVIRESGGDRSAVTGGTRVLSDWIRVKVTANPGETFLDRMIALVEGAERQKTPNEIALNILLAGLTIVFLIAVVTLQPFAIYSGSPQSLFVLISLLVCLIPDDDWRSAFGDRYRRHGSSGAVTTSSRCRGARSKPPATSTRCSSIRPARSPSAIARRRSSCLLPGVSDMTLADAAQLASLPDETPEGRSIVVFAKEKYRPSRSRSIRASGDVRALHRADADVRCRHARRRPALAAAGAAGLRARLGRARDPQGRRRRHREVGHFKGRRDPGALPSIVQRISRAGGTPLVVADGRQSLGVIHLKDIVKGGIRERFAHLRAMGIKTVMITGDNPLTAAAIASEAGVDDFLAQATPEDKMALIKREQADGKLVAMTGDGTNDAPALAQADVGVAMNTGTQAAKEAGNMVDLDSNPTKLIEIVEIGKQLLITRGALTTFSIANDVAKYFAIVPAMFLAAFPVLGALNVMGLKTPESAILSAVIFNAVIIVALVPLALRGIRYRPVGAAALLRSNLLIYGVGGIVVPFIGIKAIDVVITALGLA